MERIEYVTIESEDGFKLTGTAYSPKPGEENGDAVFICSAMGVSRGYYNKFAHFLMERGYKVLTFDYRGIGASWPKGDKGDTYRASQWGESDIPAAISWVKHNFQPKRLLMVGHSVGGQILSLVPNNQEIDKIILVGSQLGEARLWEGLQRIKVYFFWYVALPSLVGLMGKLPGWLLGSEDLPKGVALQWRKWGTSRGYILCEGPHVSQGFARIEAPMLFYSFSDDSFAPQKAVEALIEAYAGAEKEYRHLKPADIGVKTIEHFGFFKSKFAETLWVPAAQWLEK